MKNIRIFYLKNCHVLVVKFSVYLNRRVFVMRSVCPNIEDKCDMASSYSLYFDNTLRQIDVARQLSCDLILLGSRLTVHCQDVCSTTLFIIFLLSRTL